MNVSNSTTPIGERLTDTRRKIQWKDINWKTVTDSVNRLQIRITKAVNQGNGLKGDTPKSPDCGLPIDIGMKQEGENGYFQQRRRN